MTDVRLEFTDGVATITLHRPESLNALNLALATGLRKAVSEVRDSHARALVLAGAGRAFCAGGDVRAMADADAPGDYLRALTGDVHAAIRELRSLPLPVIARVHGAVAGGGLGLVLASDVVIASEDATFSAAYGALGLSPDCGVSALLPAAVGAVRARAFLLGLSRLDAHTAVQWGLASHAVARDELDREVDAAVTRVSAIGRDAVRATKGLLDDPAPSLETQMAREAASISDLADLAVDRLRQFAAR